MQQDDELIKGEEVCRLGKIEKSTLYDWVYKGKIQRVKVGSRNRYVKSYIMRFFGLTAEEVKHE